MNFRTGVTFMRFTDGFWSIRVARSAFPGHLSGFITQEGTGERFLFLVLGGKLLYSRRRLPEYVKDFLLNGVHYAGFRNRLRDNWLGCK